MNPILLQSYQLGVVIGIIVLSTLILFPGTKDDGYEIADAATGSTIDDTANETSTPHVLSSTYPATYPVPKKRKDINASSQQLQQNYRNYDADIPNLLSPHRRLNWLVYILIYIVVAVILCYSYSNSAWENQDEIPLYRRQLQNPTKLIQLTFEAYFPKEASVMFGRTTATASSNPPKTERKAQPPIN